jgi:hypothetical protein
MLDLMSQGSLMQCKAYAGGDALVLSNFKPSGGKEPYGYSLSFFKGAKTYTDMAMHGLAVKEMGGRLLLTGTTSLPSTTTVEDDAGTADVDETVTGSMYDAYITVMDSEGRTLRKSLNFDSDGMHKKVALAEAESDADFTGRLRTVDAAGAGDVSSAVPAYSATIKDGALLALDKSIPILAVNNEKRVATDADVTTAGDGIAADSDVYWLGTTTAEDATDGTDATVSLMLSPDWTLEFTLSVGKLTVHNYNPDGNDPTATTVGTKTKVTGFECGERYYAKVESAAAGAYDLMWATVGDAN